MTERPNRRDFLQGLATATLAPAATALAAKVQAPGPKGSKRTKDERKRQLIGAVVSLRTFRTPDGKLDLDKQRRHLRWLIEHGITTGNAVVMGAGGGGEGYFMDDSEWQTIVELTAKECQGRVPSMAGIWELSARECAKKATYCAQVGIDFVQIPPPHYFVPTDDEVYHHIKAVNDAADVGIMLYNTSWAMPQPGYDFKPPLLERLCQLEHVVGIKWACPNLRNYVTCLRLFATKLNFIDNQPRFVLSLPLKLGAVGFIDAAALTAPRLTLHFWDLWKNKKYDEYDQIVLQMNVDPYLKVHLPEEAEWRGMGEGPLAAVHAEAMGLKIGPRFPAQQPLSQAYIKNFMEGFTKSGVSKWIDWKE